MEPALEKRGNRVIYHLHEKRVPLPMSVQTIISPAKSTRTSTSLWDIMAQEGMLASRFMDSRESLRTLKMCNNWGEAVIRTSKGSIRSARLTEEVSNSHINNLVLPLSNPEVKM